MRQIDKFMRCCMILCVFEVDFHGRFGSGKFMNQSKRASIVGRATSGSYF